MIQARFKPIENWPSEPTPSWKREAGRFKAGWMATLDLLERELNSLRATDITVEAFFRPQEIRNDGWPKSSARPAQPGVVLSFETKRGRMVMPCDRYSNWEFNLRAIALTLEHLRAVERYGVTTEQQEQYTGWLRLPAASSNDEAMQCARVLCRCARLADGFVASVVANQDDFKDAYRQACRYTHPDHTHAATEREFQEVQSAASKLKEIKGWI